MDQGKLQQIRTYSQTFTNDPRQKFLLMILCSQAKLENDQKGINVKRGIRAKCEMGWRPGPAPIGYMNISQGGIKKIIQDPERAPHIKEMFELVAHCDYSGRDIKRMFDKEKVTTPTGCKIVLSAIYRMLKNPFFYGEFEYPEGSGQWYKGEHEPVVPKELFDLVQKKVFAPFKADWGSKEFDYAKVFKCAACNRPLSGDEKFRKLKNGNKRHHVYYHCTRSFYNHCDQPYTNESILETEIIKFVDTNVHKITISSELEEVIVRFERLRDGVLDQHKVLKATRDLDLAGYAKHIVRNGTRKEKQFFIHGLLTRPKLWNRQLIFTQK